MLLRFWKMTRLAFVFHKWLPKLYSGNFTPVDGLCHVMLVKEKIGRSKNSVTDKPDMFSNIVSSKTINIIRCSLGWLHSQVFSRIANWPSLLNSQPLPTSRRTWQTKVAVIIHIECFSSLRKTGCKFIPRWWNYETVISKTKMRLVLYLTCVIR